MGLQDSSRPVLLSHKNKVILLEAVLSLCPRGTQHLSRSGYDLNRKQLRGAFTLFDLGHFKGHTVPLDSLCMLQRAADVYGRTSVVTERQAGRTSQDSCVGCLFLVEARHFSSLSFPRQLRALWGHDFGTMSDSSLWTLLSNFSMPHFISGARLRRSKR